MIRVLTRVLIVVVYRKMTNKASEVIKSDIIRAHLYKRNFSPPPKNKKKTFFILFFEKNNYLISRSRDEKSERLSDWERIDFIRFLDHLEIRSREECYQE